MLHIESNCSFYSSFQSLCWFEELTCVQEQRREPREAERPHVELFAPRELPQYEDVLLCSPFSSPSSSPLTPKLLFSMRNHLPSQTRMYAVSFNPQSSLTAHSERVRCVYTIQKSSCAFVVIKHVGFSSYYQTLQQSNRNVQQPRCAAGHTASLNSIRNRCSAAFLPAARPVWH